jgi:hypothetical protein
MLPVSKLAVIFSFISKVGTTLELLVFSFDFTDTGIMFVSEINKTKLPENWFENFSLGVFLVVCAVGCNV